MDIGDAKWWGLRDASLDRPFAESPGHRRSTLRQPLRRDISDMPRRTARGMESIAMAFLAIAERSE